MKNTKAVYTLEITLATGEKAVKIGYTDDINERFKDADVTPTIVLYVDKPNMSKSFVASVKDYYRDVEIAPGFYPIQYSTLLELRLINFENELNA